MVAGEDHLATLAHHVDAIAGIGSIAHDIAEAEDLLALESVDLRQDGIECFSIPVDVRDDGDAQVGSSSARTSQDLLGSVWPGF